MAKDYSANATYIPLRVNFYAPTGLVYLGNNLVGAAYDANTVLSPISGYNTPYVNIVDIKHGTIIETITTTNITAIRTAGSTASYPTGHNLGLKATLNGNIATLDVIEYSSSSYTGSIQNHVTIYSPQGHLLAEQTFFAQANLGSTINAFNQIDIAGNGNILLTTKSQNPYTVILDNNLNLLANLTYTPTDTYNSNSIPTVLFANGHRMIIGADQTLGGVSAQVFDNNAHPISGVLQLPNDIFAAPIVLRYSGNEAILAVQSNNQDSCYLIDSSGTLNSVPIQSTNRIQNVVVMSKNQTIMLTGTQGQIFDNNLSPLTGNFKYCTISGLIQHSVYLGNDVILVDFGSTGAMFNTSIALSTNSSSHIHLSSSTGAATSSGGSHILFSSSSTAQHTDSTGSDSSSGSESSAVSSVDHSVGTALLLGATALLCHSLV